jgi:dTDP-4-dehydrorhamnose 3,5-epimerase
MRAESAGWTRRLPTARDACEGRSALPQGVNVIQLSDHADERGVFRELFRNSWAVSDSPVQWNMVSSRGNVLRGVHAHPGHVDHLTMAAGEMILGLHDLRPDSPTFRLSLMLWLQAEDPHLIEIARGVAHGFYFPEPAVHIYGVSKAFAGADGFACRWDDPALNLDWPCEAPILSERDRAAGSYAALAGRFQTHPAE